MNEPIVLVIGAGMAGLSAAWSLHDAGIHVIVIEARERIGGRIWTHQGLGTSLDMGASWIHGVKKNPIAKLAKQLNVKTTATDFESFIAYDANGQLIPDDDVEWAENLLADVMETLDEDREELDEDTSLKAGIDPLLEAYHLSSTQKQLMDFVIANEIEHDYAANIDKMSLWYWDQDEEFKGEHVIFPDGYRQLVDHLARGLDIRYKMPVATISYDERQVIVTTSDGNKISGTHALVTVPLGVLQSNTITFSPPLPKHKQHAINQLKMGTFVKVYLRFPHVFWDKDYEFIGYVSDKPDEWSLWMNYYVYSQQPILMAINTGTFGQHLEQLADPEIIQQAMHVLQAIYGEQIPQPEDYLITHWGDDPYTQGAYSYIPVGVSGKAYDAMAAPIDDRLFFAGEATSRDYASTVHGAFLSGKREAKRIRNVLR